VSFGVPVFSSRETGRSSRTRGRLVEWDFSSTSRRMTCFLNGGGGQRVRSYRAHSRPGCQARGDHVFDPLNSKSLEAPHQGHVACSTSLMRRPLLWPPFCVLVVAGRAPPPTA
jgi:hypothetical protein